ncbi:globin domain-containing protein [Tengunoibacter tsumagoiensis]|uniref:Globin domain-containing protein n=1 Tax=Tengunoibacter tsumagoiensis TaxID=2014871 RepID=A0A402A3X0_9CHLR|nr:globin domain-containing protein [Tengunoibacter tsumagoiensis]GCE13772.1 hypothetical protein KTT_36310 [Tengunoibacter tsumagoiensis]
MNALALKTSFALLGARKESFAHTFYLTFFARYPAAQELFVQDLLIQERSLMATLDLIVQGADQGIDLGPTLYKLGLRHEAYGVRAEQYAWMGEILLETFRALLGELFTSDMEQAWIEAYKYMSTEMQQATTHT